MILHNTERPRLLLRAFHRRAEQIFKPIRTRAEPAGFCPYKTPLWFLNNTPCSLSFQCVATVGPFITGSYEDRRKTPFW